MNAEATMAIITIDVLCQLNFSLTDRKARVRSLSTAAEPP